VGVLRYWVGGETQTNWVLGYNALCPAWACRLVYAMLNAASLITDGVCRMVLNGRTAPEASGFELTQSLGVAY
jgi:hypothetical protein